MVYDSRGESYVTCNEMIVTSDGLISVVCHRCHPVDGCC